MKKILKMVATILLGIILILTVVVVFFVNLSPQFGARPDDENMQRIKTSPQYRNGKFSNITKGNDQYTFSDYLDMFSKMVKNRPGATPFNRTLPRYKGVSGTNKHRVDSLTNITWLGHSALYLKIDGLNILIDPMLGETYGPLTFMNRGQRFVNSKPIKPGDFSKIDAILISHDHYDHLDYNTIKQLQGKVEHYFVPLGVAAHLISWGIDKNLITELDWWEEVQFKKITFVATPSQHFSGRGLTDQFSTLWMSWVIIGRNEKIYFSGDSGYFDGFKQIGDKYGPFDLTMIECGQYSDMWPNQHIFPEQTAQAHLDLKGKILMPIHWGAFLMSPSHDWDEPIERLSKKTEELNIELTTPMIGQSITMNMDYPSLKWWKNGQ